MPEPLIMITEDYDAIRDEWAVRADVCGKGITASRTHLSRAERADAIEACVAEVEKQLGGDHAVEIG